MYEPPRHEGDAGQRDQRGVLRLVGQGAQRQLQVLVVLLVDGELIGTVLLAIHLALQCGKRGTEHPCDSECSSSMTVWHLAQDVLSRAPYSVSVDMLVQRG